VIGHRLGLRLFLEGIEVPVIGASVTVARNTPAAASIQVVATDKVLNLLPRTIVHLFFYDFVDSTSPVSTTETTNVADQFNERYKLLFMGELQGLQFQKNPGQRSVVLNCVDFSNYWDTTYQYNFRGSLFGGRRHAAFIGANANFFTSPLGHGVGTIAALLNGKSVNFPDLKGLLAGTIRILEAIGGSYYGDKTFKGANDFTSIAELRLKILQQITAAEKDNSTAKLFARKTFNMWMNRQMGSLGKLVTFRGLTQLLQKFIYHTTYPCPSPKYVSKVTGLKKTKSWASDISKDPRARKFISDVKRLRKLLVSAQTNLGAYPAAAATGTTKYSNTTATKIGGSKVVSGVTSDLAAANRISRSLTTSTPKIAGLNKEVATISTELRKVDRAISAGVSIAGFRLDTTKISKGENRATALNAIGLAIAACDTLLGVKVKKSKEVTYDKLDRVNNQILIPDIWFAAPPRCNILFPELYSQFNWSRNFLREVSRLELQTTNEILGDDALFNGRYYAPNVADMRSGIRLSSRKFGRLILGHELLTGIIPMFEKLSEANLFAMKSRKVKFKGAKVGYAQRAVNHQYFKHRFASRQMQCQGRFNPWFVPGFPGVIIDHPMSSENLRISGLDIAAQLSALDITPSTGLDITKSILLRKLVPTQYLGTCVQMSHTLSQQGGNTSYQFGQARLHREDTEFLGVDKATINKKIGNGSKTDVYASSLVPEVGMKGPRGGKITKVTDVTTAYMGSRVKSFRGKGKDEVGRLVEATKTFISAYRISETYTRRLRKRIDLPIEEAIRPPWIWDGWTNLKIGETYDQFFGVDSITDVEAYGSTDALTSLLEVSEGVATGSKTYQSDDTEFKSQLKALKSDETAVKNKVEGEDVTALTSADEKLSAVTIKIMESEATIEAAIDYLVRVYSYVKHNDLDVGSFLRNYTWRPVATMVEILGSDDFTITKDGSTSSGYKTSGTEGFHSRAFGDEADLFGLVDPKVKKVLGLTKDKEAVAKKLDVRARRREAVWDYMDEISSSVGLLG
jgi:hypothetical protein